jgi:ribonucleoside-diphosphate reductase alpha chain
MATYTHDEAVEASIRDFNGDELAARVWANKYALKDSFGNLYEKTPDDMHRRLAREIHRIEKKYINPLPEELIYNVLKDFRIYCSPGRSHDRYWKQFSDCITIELLCDW